jgi:KamA family protein
VILSGGDPLALNNQRFASLVKAIETISHVQRLRIHTRFPVMVPQRIDDRLIEILERCRLQVVVVLHCNHANELDDLMGSYLAKLSTIGVTLLNQSVLLAGVNSDPDSLVNLSEKLFKYSILPYYLHLLDAVDGAAHFAVDQATAKGIIAQLRQKLPGFLVPKLVKEQAFATSKVAID